MIGFVIQTNITEIGRLAANIIAKKAAITICNGRGIKAQKSPIAIALGTDFLLRCQRLDWNNAGPKSLSVFSSFILSILGNILLITFFSITVK